MIESRAKDEEGKQSMDTTKSNSNYSITSPLPPCKICGAKASGLHYGVNTCEACKGFFRRAIKFNKNYTCFREQNCDIIGGRSVRTSCPFCRLQKCLKMGMAHKAIKTGRYTHAKRTENIMEVKRLEKVKRVSPKTLANDDNHATSSHHLLLPSSVPQINIITSNIDTSINIGSSSSNNNNTTTSSTIGINNAASYHPNVPSNQNNAFHAMTFSRTPSTHPQSRANNINNNIDTVNNNSIFTPSSTRSSMFFGNQLNLSTATNNNSSSNNNAAFHSHIINDTTPYPDPHCCTPTNSKFPQKSNPQFNQLYPHPADYNGNEIVTTPQHYPHHPNQYTPAMTFAPFVQGQDRPLSSSVTFSQQEGVYISIPTPPLSSSSFEDNGACSPFGPSLPIDLTEDLPDIHSIENNNKNNHETNDIPLVPIKQEMDEFPDIDFITSSETQMTFTELLSTNAGISSDTNSSSSRFPFFQLKEENADFNDDSFTNSSDPNMCFSTLLHPTTSGTPLLAASPSSISKSSFSSSSSSSSSPIFTPPIPMHDPGMILDVKTNMSQQDKQQLLSSLIDSHRKFVITLAEYDRSFIATIQQQYMEKRKAKAEIFGITSHFVQDAEYKEIFAQTGLDVDGRHEMRLGALKSLGYFIKTVICFAQSVPGFKSLCIRDQQMIIKMGHIEQWFMNAFLGFNVNQRIVLMPNLKVFTYDEFSNLLGEDFAAKCFELAPTFQSTSVPYEILVLWKVVLLLATDRCDLSEPAKVSQLQEFYIQQLLEKIEKNKTSLKSPHFFSQLISLSTLLRELDRCMPVIFDESQILGIRAENLFKNAFADGR